MKLWPFKRRASTKRQTGQNSFAPNQQQRVFSYYTSSHKKLNNFERTRAAAASSDLQARQSRAFRKHWFSLLALVVLVSLSGYLLLLDSNPRLTIEGTKYRTAEQYQQIVSEKLSESVWNKSKLSINRSNELSMAIKEAVPEAEAVYVSSPFLGKRPKITIVNESPIAVLAQPNSQDYLVSNRGRLLLASSQSTATTDLPKISNQTGVDGQAGEQYFRPSDMKEFSNLLAQLKNDNTNVSFVLPQTPRELWMVEQSRGAYQVRFLLGDTLVQQYGALRAAQKKLQSLNQTPKAYLDVRLADKVFYQ